MHGKFWVSPRFLFFLAVFLYATINGGKEIASAAQLRLTWADNAYNESGFKIERKAATDGAYRQIGMVDANITTYADLSVTAGDSYCYRVSAYNSAGASGYSNEACGSVTISTTSKSSQVTLTVGSTGEGTGIITGAGLNCGANCVGTYPEGMQVTLAATPASDSVFSGWSGNADCADGQITLDASKTCIASFARMTPQPLFSKLWNGTKIGVFRPSTQQWFLDLDGDGQFTDCTRDACLQLKARGDVPVVGDWLGTGTTNLGLYEPNSGQWFLDRNGNDRWDGCSIDLCLGPFGLFPKNADKFPIVGKWRIGQRTDSIGIFYPRGTTNVWRLDLDDDGQFDNCMREDDCVIFGIRGTLPIIGDWVGTEVSQLGVFNPQSDLWRLDLNSNHKFDNCRIDACLGPFGLPHDLPIAGDWNDDGRAEIGVFDQSTGLWNLDLNGNGAFDGCNVDRCLGPFGQEGDLPVVGKW